MKDIYSVGIYSKCNVTEVVMFLTNTIYTVM